jgi:hypothetical protein
MIAQFLAYPLNVPPSLARVSSLATLRRHFQLALDYGTNPVAAEYLAEIKRRENSETKRAA